MDHARQIFGDKTTEKLKSTTWFEVDLRNSLFDSRWVKSPCNLLLGLSTCLLEPTINYALGWGDNTNSKIPQNSALQTDIEILIFLCKSTMVLLQIKTDLHMARFPIVGR